MMLLEFMYNWSAAINLEPQMAISPVIISAALSAAGNIYGAHKAGKNSAAANKAIENEMSAQKRANEQWYQQKMNENYLDSVEAQAALTKAREMAQEQMTTARGMQAVMGGTDAGIAATQQSVNKMLADTTSGLAAAGTARKDAFDQTYLNRNSELSQQLIDMYEKKAEQSAAAGSSALNSLSSIGSSLITALGGK